MLHRPAARQSGEQADTIRDLIKGSQQGLPAAQRARYYFASRGAGRHWSREALDYTTMHGLKQATNGTCNPPAIQSAQDAAAAYSRCALHLQLLDIACRNLDEPEVPWQLEAARHVTTATQQALGIAAKLSPRQPTVAGDVRGGIASAADALAVAIRGGFMPTWSARPRRRRGELGQPPPYSRSAAPRRAAPPTGRSSNPKHIP